MTDEFLYGAATSAHQVEGNNVHNDWWNWEQNRPLEFRSGRAADHWRLYKQDLSLAKNLGHNAHRFSIEWSRIQPERNQWDQHALRHYRAVLLELRRLEIKSFVTLHHFTNPQWFAERGGWLRHDAPQLFADYTRVVVDYFGDLVDFWLTINEPMVYATQSYWHKRWPPQKRSGIKTWLVIRRLAAAHRQTYRLIHRCRPGAKVGLAQHLIAFMPSLARQSGSRTVIALQDFWFNHYFYHLTRGTHDFIGANYYFAKSNMTQPEPVSDLGWPIRPEGLTHVLKQIKKYKLPIYVTENGLADAADSRRADFIRSHLRSIETAQKQGADVRGYLHWSLIDNFEWDLGFAPRFGLVAIDYKTMARTPRRSAYVYKGIIEQSQTTL